MIFFLYGVVDVNLQDDKLEVNLRQTCDDIANTSARFDKFE